jgi:hypothetical protein
MEHVKQSFFLTVEYDTDAPTPTATLAEHLAQALLDALPKTPRSKVQVDAGIYRNMDREEISNLFDRHGYPPQ